MQILDEMGRVKNTHGTGTLGKLPLSPANTEGPEMSLLN